MRVSGLQGLYTYITTVDDLDNFISNYVDKKNVLIPKVLANVLEYQEEESSMTPKEVNFVYLFEP